MATFVAGNSAVNMLDQLTFNVDSFYTSPDETVDVADILNGNQYLYIKFSSSAATVITQAALYVPGTTVLGQFPTANDLVWSATGLSLTDAQVAPFVNPFTGNINLALVTVVAMAGNDTITGSSFADTLVGYAGNDTINGGGGADIMLGINGNDTYIVDNVGDIVGEIAGQGIDTVISAVNYSLATFSTSGVGSLENLTLTGSAIRGIGNELNNVLTGNGNANVLIGGLGSDTLDGGLGNDTLIGGAGNDLYLVATGDQVVEGAGGGTDLVLALGDFTLTSNLDNLTLGGVGNSTGIGNELANIIRGNSGNNTINGDLGNDTLEGGEGNDTYFVDSINDKVLDVGTGIDVINSSATYSIALTPTIENITLTGSANINATGNAGANTLTGNVGNNILSGGAGNDALTGGAGNDTYVVDAISATNADVITEALGEGTDTANATFTTANQTYTLAANVENLVLGGLLAANGVGNVLNNTLTGNAAVNMLTGGDGNDTYFVGAGDTVIELAIEGTDTVNAGFTITLGANLENLTLTGVGVINGTGNGQDNVITGNAAANILDGGAGSDTLIGGAGADIYIVGSGDVVQETIAGAPGGVDTVRSSVSFDLDANGANVENVVLLAGFADVNATGNGLNNALTGNELNNTLDGGLGNDTMVGGAGDDTYVVNATGDVVTETVTAVSSDTVQASITYVLGANLENLTLTGSANINATGNTLANTLTGNNGNNVLNGGTGNDAMTGGAGNDTYFVDQAGEQPVELLDEGTDTVNATFTAANQTYTLAANVENLVLGGALATNGTGNALNNVLTGNAAANTLTGGDGNDTYFIGAGDVVTEQTNQGTDTVNSGITTILGANVENLTLTGAAAINGTGNAEHNLMTGNAAANTLDGGLGNDTMIGGAGADIYIVGSGDLVQETLAGAPGGVDTVRSSVSFNLDSDGVNVENVVLLALAGNINATGNGLNNALTGNEFDNVLDGGLGNDTMVGGVGNDTYVVNAVGDVVTETVTTVSNDTVQSSISYVLGLNLENLTLTGSANINATGNTGNNALTGNDFNNVLNGGTGNDAMDGGLGNDTYVVDAALDTVALDAGGTDTVLSSVSFSFATNASLENLTLTGTGAISGTGNALDNVLTGNAAINTLNGGDGNDTLIGGAGNDMLIGGDSNDVGIDIADYSTSAAAVNVNLTAGTATGSLIGSDILVDIEGARGGAGNDTFTGTAENNTYYVGAGDVVNEAASGGTDQVYSSATFTLGLNLENLTLTGTANLNATGNIGNNVITGNSGDNILAGGDGTDTLDGAGGFDIVDYSTAGTAVFVDLDTGVVTGGAGGDTLSSIEGVRGSSSSDELTGSGDDMVDYSTATAFVVVTLGANGTANGTTIGSDLLHGFLVVRGSAFNDTLAGDTGNNTLIGGAGNDALNGADGNDTLDGGTGNDALAGGAGSDVYFVDSLTDVVTEAGGDGFIDEVRSTVSFDLSLAGRELLENVTLLGTALTAKGNALDNVLTGNASANTLTGGAGNDTLDGKAGADTMLGGADDDTYIVDNAGDIVNEVAVGSGGNDTVSTALTYTLGLNLENLILTGTANVNGTGNTGNNTLVGNTGNNVLNGGIGNDAMDGGLGNDTYVVDAAGDSVAVDAGGTDTVLSSVTFNMGSNSSLENLTLTGTAITGIGNAGANVITGNAGNNGLNGLGGNDTLIGGAGNDTYVVDSAGDVIQETIAGAAGGLDTVNSSLDWILGANLENLTLMLASGAVSGTGNVLNNVITGNGNDNTLTGLAGNDTLDGGAGNDTLDGGVGNDTYLVDSIDDVVLETTAGAAGGVDTVRSTVGFDLSLPGNANVENVLLESNGSDADATGNGLNNVLTGNANDNVLSGGLGADTLIGGAGNDTLDGGAGVDSMAGGLGDDVYYVESATDAVVELAGQGNDTLNTAFTTVLAATLENLTLTGAGNVNGTGNIAANIINGNSGNNQLFGLVGNDTISGGGGNDILDGGVGNDSLTGGTGNDTYVSDSTTDELIELADEGTDTVLSSVSIALLGANIENATLTVGLTAISVTGNGLDNRIIGNALANTLNGGAGNDTLTGGLGNDILLGGAGNDTFIFEPGDTGTINGGALENDTLLFTGAGLTLNLATLPGAAETALDNRYESIETIDLTGSGNNTLVLDPQAVLALTDDSNILYVNGNVGDQVNSINEGWTSNGTQSIGDVLYAKFILGSTELWVDTDVGFTIS